MSNNLEGFIKNNRDKFDSQVPSNQVWNNIQTGLAQQAAAAAGSSAAGASTAAKSGIAKIALGWKIALVTTITAIVGTGIYFVATNGNQDGKDPSKMTAVVPQGADDNAALTSQAEYLYEASPVVTPPMPETNVPYLGFTVSADNGGTWTAPSGTVLTVDPGTFVDAQGKPVTGDVQIKYREFHDAEDIILSGITMKYNENGAQENFQTAGMMEILGKQGESPVYIAQGKEIDVRMASFTPEDDYNLYFLDPKAGWKDIGKPTTEANPAKKASKPGKDLEGSGQMASVPRPPVKGEKGVEQDGEVMFNVDYDEFPELRPYKEVRWMAEDKAAYAKLEDKIHSHVWNDATLDELDSEGLRYKITLKRKSKATLSVNVKPILEDEDYEKGMKRFKEKKAAYDKMVMERAQEQDRLGTQADVYRSFSISGFGIYNCDRFYGSKDAVSYNTKFEFPENSYVNASNTVVYHITGNNRAVMTLTPTENVLLKFNPSDDNYLVVVIPGSKVAVFGPAGFKSLLNKSKSMQQKVVFEAKETEVHSAADLRLILGV
ncbi:MAG: hypothetical protein IPP17_15270 [Bacteroidetes bacterium]|nr:hypothetical protein [Bacteroidota bacterium]